MGCQSSDAGPRGWLEQPDPEHCDGAQLGESGAHRWPERETPVAQGRSPRRAPTSTPNNVA
eukprot:8005822-Pyramimonas_sp.AAC.1